MIFAYRTANSFIRWPSFSSYSLANVCDVSGVSLLTTQLWFIHLFSNSRLKFIELFHPANHIAAFCKAISSLASPAHTHYRLYSKPMMKRETHGDLNTGHWSVKGQDSVAEAPLWSSRRTVVMSLRPWGFANFRTRTTAGKPILIFKICFYWFLHLKKQDINKK